VSVYDIEGNDYSKTGLMIIFMTLFLLNALNNIDHGAIPAITPVLKEDLNLNSQQLGFLGSLVFLGVTVGSIIATFILEKLSYKSIISISVFFNGCGLIMFASSTNYNFQCFARFMSGFC
jgi:fucose permease